LLPFARALLAPASLAPPLRVPSVAFASALAAQASIVQPASRAAVSFWVRAKKKAAAGFGVLGTLPMALRPVIAFADSIGRGQCTGSPQVR
jgi:hypothetical protein